MGKMLLGGFALSLGIAGVTGASSPTPAMNPAAIVQQQKAKANQRYVLLVDSEDGAASDEENVAQERQQFVNTNDR